MVAFNPSMQIRRFFINDVGRLRSGWRLLLFVCVFVAVIFLVGLCLRIAYALVHHFLPPVPHGAFIANLINHLSLLFSALLAGYFCTRLLEGLPWRALGLTFHSGWFRDLLVGSVLGIASLALAAMIATAGGSLRFTISGAGILLLVGKSLVSSAVLFIIAALAEEAMFRGYPLQTLSRAGLISLGVLLTSVPFASAHLWNPNVVPGVTFANTALAGVWLAAAYLRTEVFGFR